MSMLNRRGNKGEWSEAYVFLKLLYDGRLYEGDAENEIMPSSYVDILAVLRKQSDLIIEYRCDGDAGIVIIKNGTAYGKPISKAEISINARHIIEAIPHLTSAENTIPSTDALFDKMGITSIKAASITDKDNPIYAGKSDIALRTTDRMGATREAGYSIKSFVGNSPTLLNSAVASGVVYKIKGANTSDANRINMMIGPNGEIDIDSRIDYIREQFELIPAGTAIVKGRQPFAENLEICGKDMLPLIQHALLYRYGVRNGTKYVSLSECIAELVVDNPLEVGNPSAYYPARFKQLVYDAFAGLSATTPWNGKRRLNGGYIDVKSDGQILYHPAVSDDAFTSYLVSNMKFEAPDKGIGGLNAAVEAFRNDGKAVPPKLSKRFADKAMQSGAVRGNYGFAFYSEDYGEPGYFFTLNFSLRFK